MRVRLFGTTSVVTNHTKNRSPVAIVYLGVCPRMEPACGSETPLGDSTRVSRTILYNHVHGNHTVMNSIYSIGPFLHRCLWEQKVAKKVKVSKLFSQLSSCTLFMGAKSCEKSLETFTFDNNRAIWSKSLQTFCAFNTSYQKLPFGSGSRCTTERSRIVIFSSCR